MDVGIEGGFSFLEHHYSRLPVKVLDAVEFDKRLADFYLLNHSARMLCEDVRDVSSSTISDHDILLGGFPCQSFSIVAQNPPRLGYKDARGQLFFEMCRLLGDKNPRVFIAENVKGILSANQRRAFPLIVQEFEKVGYYVRWALLNSADFGVPQKRERVFIVGFRDRDDWERFEFPEPVTPFRDVPLAAVLERDEATLRNFYFSDRALRGLKTARSGRAMNKGRVQPHDEPSNTVGAHLAKVSLNSTDPVVETDGRLRMFTPREVARIQSFPESFRLTATRSTNYIGLGNAVPPVLMWHVSNAVLSAMERDPAIRRPERCDLASARGDTLR